MKHLLFAIFALFVMAVAFVSGMPQPPGGKEKGQKKEPAYELGKVLPPFAMEGLQLTDDQKKKLGELEKEVRAKLLTVLTPDQVETLKELKGPKGPQDGGKGDKGFGKKGDFNGKAKAEVKERPEALKVDLTQPPAGLVKNPRFTQAGSDAKTPAHFSLQGDVAWVPCGAEENTDQGIAFYASKGQRAGLVTQSVTRFQGGVGKWFRFTFRGLAESGFKVEKDALFMRVDYFSKNGTNPLDGLTQNIYPLVERYRKELAENGKYRKNGGNVWKTYTFDFRLPFAEIDTLNLTVGFKNGSATSEKGSEFYVTEFSLTPIPAPENAPKVVKVQKRAMPNLKSLISLGGAGITTRKPA